MCTQRRQLMSKCKRVCVATKVYKSNKYKNYDFLFNISISKCSCTHTSKQRITATNKNSPSSSAPAPSLRHLTAFASTSCPSVILRSPRTESCGKVRPALITWGFLWLRGHSLSLIKKLRKPDVCCVAAEWTAEASRKSHGRAETEEANPVFGDCTETRGFVTSIAHKRMLFALCGSKLNWYMQP